MATTNMTAALPLKTPDGAIVLPVTHADYVIDGVNRYNPVFYGSITLNGIKVLSTTTDSEGNTSVNPLSPENGGTGVSSIDALAALIASALGYTTAGVVPIEKGGTGSTTASAALTALGAASAVLYNATVSTTWSGSSDAGYTQTVTVSGIRNTDVPVVGVVLSSDKSSAVLQGKAFACINRITTATNSITLYAYTTQPTTAITIQLLVVRGF